MRNHHLAYADQMVQTKNKIAMLLMEAGIVHRKTRAAA
jgi:hypothetical protein